MNQVERLGLEDQIVAAVRRIMRAVDLHSRRLSEEFGLTGPQLATMRECQRLGLVTPSALAKAVHLSNATMSGILTRLEKRGLVERARSRDDRRSFHVRLTPAGRAILERSPSLLQDRFRRELEKIEEWEQHMALAMLQRIASMMDADDLEAAPHLVTDESALEPDPAE